MLQTIYHLCLTFQPLLGHCFFFVRHFSEKAIKPDNVHKDVYFGYFEVENGDLLGGIEFYLSRIIMPALKATTVSFSRFKSVKVMYVKGLSKVVRHTIE